MATPTISQMQTYVQTAQARQQQRQQKLDKRRQRASAIAHQAAQLLKTEFAASRVVLFGSVLGKTFHESSDIDLAVWDLPEQCYFQAISKLLALSKFEVDLVEIQYATLEILAAIAQGQEL